MARVTRRIRLATRKATAQGARLAVAAATTGRVKRYLLRRLGRQRQNVDDLAQEVYLRLLRIPEETLLRQEPRYLFRVAASVLSDFCTAESRHEHVLYDSELIQDSADGAELDDPLANIQWRSELEQALTCLSARQQAVILLQVRDGYTYEEIAQKLQLSIHTVQEYLADAKARLRTVLWP